MPATEEKRVLIADGYTLSRTLPATRRRPEVKVSYRPALPGTVYGFLQAEPGATGDDLLKKTVRLLIKHLVSWDVKETRPGSDEPVAVPITAENLAKVPHQLLQQIAAAVIDYAAEEAEADAGN